MILAGASESDDAHGQVKLLRELGPQERYQVMCTNIGSPPVVVMLAEIKYSLCNSALLLQIQDRINELLRISPLLSCSIIDSTSRSPKFGHHSQLLPSSILRIHSFPSSNVDDCGKLLNYHISFASREFRLNRSPLWSVDFYESEEGNSAIVLSAHHVIVDGRGTANLLELLLTPRLPSIANINGGLQDGQIPDHAHASLNLHVRKSTLIVSFWKELIKPYFSGMLQNKRIFQEKNTSRWPARLELHKHPSSTEIGRIIVNVDQADVFLPQLKEQARKNGMLTINSVIYCACLISIFTLAWDDKFSKIQIPSGTSISERQVRCLQHGLCTGNFVSVLHHEVSLKPADNPLRHARTYGILVHSKKGREKAREFVAMLSWVPDAKRWQSTEEFPTQWEYFFSSRRRKKQPYSMAFGLSNLGIVRLPEYVSRLAWGQMPLPEGAPFIIDSCGLSRSGSANKESLSISVGYRDGVLPAGSESLFTSYMTAALELLAMGQVDEQCTMQEVCQKVKKKVS